MFSGSEALADFELMFSNCYLYNKPTDDVTLMCQEVESYFKQIVKRVPTPEEPLQLEPTPVKAIRPTPKNKKSRPPPVKKEIEAVTVGATVDAEKQARLGTTTTTAPLPLKVEPKAEPISEGPQQMPTSTPTLASRRRGIKRPDATNSGAQEHEKKRARKRKRWWSGTKQFIDFMFNKKHYSKHYIIPNYDTRLHILDTVYPFYEPVNHVALGLNDYLKIIKTPMDLGTIKRQLEADHYDEYESVWADVKLMFDNCCLYNPPGHDVVKMAKKAEALAEKRYHTKNHKRVPLIIN